MNLKAEKFECFKNHGLFSSIDRTESITRIAKASHSPRSPWEEAIESALHIQKIAQAPICLCLSGGVDSEAMLLAFLAAKVPFTAVACRYGPNFLNQEDISRAESLCHEHGIPLQWLDLDLEEFFLKQKKHIDFGIQFGCRSPQIAVHIEIASLTPGVPIFAGQTLTLDLDLHGRIALQGLAEPQMALFRYFRIAGRKGVPFFLSYSPELIYSFWKTPAFHRHAQKVVDEQKRMSQLENPRSLHPPYSFSRGLLSYEEKLSLYRDGGFQVQGSDQKRTGFEKAKLHFRSYFETNRMIAPWNGGIEPFDLFFRRPLEAMRPYPRRLIYQYEGGHAPSILDLSLTLDPSPEPQSHQRSDLKPDDKICTDISIWHKIKRRFLSAFLKGT